MDDVRGGTSAENLLAIGSRDLRALELHGTATRQAVSDPTQLVRGLSGSSASRKRLPRHLRL